MHKKSYILFWRKKWGEAGQGEVPHKQPPLYSIQPHSTYHTTLNEKNPTKKFPLFTLLSCFPHLPRKKCDKKPTKKRQKRRYFYRLIRYIICRLYRLRRCRCRRYCYRMIVTTTVIILSYTIYPHHYPLTH